MSNIKLVAVDIDGTLANHHGRIVETNRRAIADALKAGIIVVLATTRWYRSALKFAEELSLRTPIICCNGALVRCPGEEADLLHLRIPLKAALSIATYADAQGYELCTTIGDITYFPQRPGQALGWWEQGKYIVRSNREAMTSPPTRILAFGHEVVRALVQEFKESLRHDVRFYIHHLEGKPFSLAIVHAQASKGRALKLVCKRLGVPSQSVLAIGDDEADIDMFAVAAISVAVAEAPGEVLRAADFVGPSCEQGAVAWALRSFVL